MSNILVDYMKKRLKTEINPLAKSKTHTGPVVTISREYGCPANHLAGLLAAQINVKESERRSRNHWKWIGKEILEESAIELNMKPNLVRDFVNKEEVGIVSEILASLTNKPYPSDLKIKRTIAEIIRSFAEGGHIIIVGRGGVSLTRNMPNSLHIRLQAPLEWRINEVSKRKMISLDEAKKMILHTDAQRDQIVQFFAGKKTDNTLYDVIFNYPTLGDDVIVSTIIQMMELKNII